MVQLRVIVAAVRKQHRTIRCRNTPFTIQSSFLDTNPHAAIVQFLIEYVYVPVVNQNRMPSSAFNKQQTT